MARARNIKPGFFESEQVGLASPAARLLFIALWQLADREGRLEDRPKRIQAYAFRYDEPGTVDADKLLNELLEQRLIERYETNGVRVIWIPAFKAHQNPHHREPDSELPEKASELLGKVGASPRQASESLGKPQASLGITGLALGKPEACPNLAPTLPQPSPNLAVLNPESLLLNPDGAVVLNRAVPTPPTRQQQQQQQPEFLPFGDEPDVQALVSEAVEEIAQFWPMLGNVPNAKRVWERHAVGDPQGADVWCRKIRNTAMIHAMAHEQCRKVNGKHFIPTLERWVQDGDYARKPPTAMENKPKLLIDLYPEVSDAS